MFNETNYRKLRAYLLTREGKFDWMQGYQRKQEDPACVACACLTLEGRDTYGGWPADIQSFLGCSYGEASALWVPEAGSRGFVNGRAENTDVHAAIARLDEVALRYGVRPQTESHRVAELEDARPTQSLESHSASERAVAADTAREDGSLAGSSPAPMTTFVPNEAAFLDACRQIAAGVPREQVR